ARGVWRGIPNVHDVSAHPRSDPELGEQPADRRIATQHPQHALSHLRSAQDREPNATDLDDRAVRRASPRRPGSYEEAVPLERKRERVGRRIGPHGDDAQEVGRKPPSEHAVQEAGRGLSQDYAKLRHTVDDATGDGATLEEL